MSLCRWLTVGGSTLCARLTTDGSNLSCRKVGNTWALPSTLSFNCLLHQCQKQLQQSEWYSTAECFQLCSKWGSKWNFLSCDGFGAGIGIMKMLMALSMAQLHLLCQDDQNEVQHDFFGYVILLAPVLASHDVKGTTAFINWRWSKWGGTPMFWSCDAIDTGNCITWC